MKASNILLAVLLSMILLITVGSNLVLKAEFDKIDRKNPFAGYKKESVKPFKHIKLEGKELGLTEIRQGDIYEIRMMPEHRYLDVDVVGDTLKLTYKRDGSPDDRGAARTLNAVPSFYIIAPAITSVDAKNITWKLRGWKGENMLIKQSGSGFGFADSDIANLHVEASGGAFTRFDAKNAFGAVNIAVKDSSTLVVEKDVLKTFNAQVDNSAHISVPGSLLRKMGPM
jgi:hypothetical protein